MRHGPRNCGGDAADEQPPQQASARSCVRPALVAAVVAVAGLLWVTTTDTLLGAAEAGAGGAAAGGAQPVPDDAPQSREYAEWIATPPNERAALSPRRPPRTALNVLSIVVDDLRVVGTAFGQHEVPTPNIDRLSEGGLSVTRAFSQFPVCASSRNSFMSGRNPDKTRCWSFNNHFREAPGAAEWVAMPQHWKQAGYVTAAAGKTYHPDDRLRYDGNVSWTPPGSVPRAASGPGDGHGTVHIPGYLPYFEPWCKRDAASVAKQRVPYYCPDDAPDEGFMDTHYVAHTIKAMDAAVAAGRPFFAMAGLTRPHIPYRVPERFFAAAGRPSDYQVAAHRHFDALSPSIPRWAYSHSGFESPLRYNGTWHNYGPRRPMPEAAEQLYRHAYAAAVMFMDHNVGVLLDYLQEQGLWDNTVVALWSDHGFKLGENGAISKQDLWDHSTRVPLIVRSPRHPQTHGTITGALAALVDLYPTLHDLSAPGMPIKDDEGLDGMSLLSLFEDPKVRAGTSPGPRRAAFSQHPRCGGQEGSPVLSQRWGRTWVCMHTDSSKFTVMGYAVRTAEYRYIQWREWDGAALQGKWADDSDAGAAAGAGAGGGAGASASAQSTVGSTSVDEGEDAPPPPASSALWAEELYDHRGDDGRGRAAFDDFDFHNVAADAAYAATKAELAALLRGHFDHSGGRP